MKNKALAFTFALGLAGAILAGASMPAKAATIAVPPLTGANGINGLLDHEAAAIVKVGHRRRARRAGKRFNKREFRRHHRRFHRRYHPAQPRFRRAHRRFHRHYTRKHSGPTIYFGIYPRYYDPYYYRPYYYDPYYYGPSYSAKLSCASVMRIIRQHGYRRVRARDCTGKIYWIDASIGGRRYKIRVNAYSGQILGRYRL